MARNFGQICKFSVDGRSTIEFIAYNVNGYPKAISFFFVLHHSQNILERQREETPNVMPSAMKGRYIYTSKISSNDSDGSDNEEEHAF